MKPKLGLICICFRLIIDQNLDKRFLTRTHKIPISYVQVGFPNLKQVVWILRSKIYEIYTLNYWSVPPMPLCIIKTPFVTELSENFFFQLNFSSKRRQLITLTRMGRTMGWDNFWRSKTFLMDIRFQEIFISSFWVLPQLEISINYLVKNLEHKYRNTYSFRNKFTPLWGVARLGDRLIWVKTEIGLIQVCFSTPFSFLSWQICRCLGIIILSLTPHLTFTYWNWSFFDK